MGLKGIAPNATTLIATHYEGAPNTSPVTFTRPLCPYPQAATSNGTGNPNAATNFTCTNSPR